MRTATITEIDQLVAMMQEFYADSPYTLNADRAAEAFQSLLSDERLGRVWFIQAGTTDVGYVVVTFCHSMNYGGLVAIVDDFFIRQAFRGVGLGKAALAAVRDFCAANGIRAVHVETGHENAPALAVYRRTGFIDAGHVHLSLALAEPTHDP